MKKVVLGAAVCAMAFSVNTSVQASDFDGLYTGIGIGASFLESDTPETNNVNATIHGKNEAGQVVRIGTFKGTGSLSGNKEKANRVVGSLAIGGGKVFSDRVYVGAEVLADFTNNKKVGDWNTNFSMKGFIPQVNAKVGCVFGQDTMAYGKFGCALSRVSQERSFIKKLDSEVAGTVVPDKSSERKTSFILGMGAEKVFRNKVAAVLEADYNFGFRWKDEHHKTFIDDSIYVPTGWNLKCNKGWTIRALVKYRAKY